MSQPINFNNDRVVLQSAVNVEDNSVAVVLSEETEVVRYSWSDGMYFLTLKHGPENVDLSRKDILSVFINHDTRDLPIGKFDNVRIEDNKLKAVAKFDSKDESSMKIFNKLADGFLQSFSVGINVQERVLSKEVDGVKYYDATKWEITEASVVGVPAIVGAKVGLNQDDENLGVNPASVQASAKIEKIEKGDSMEYTEQSFKALEDNHAEALKNETKRTLNILELSGDMAVKIDAIENGLSAGDVAITLNKATAKQVTAAKTDFEAAAEEVQDLAGEETPTGEELTADEKAIQEDDAKFYKKEGEK